MPIDFPRRQIALLQAHAARLLDRRKPKTPTAGLARDLLAAFHDVCMQAGLDRVLLEVEQAFPSEGAALPEHPTLVPALTAQIDAVDIDGGGPRNAKPGQLVNSVVAALGLNLSDDRRPTIALDDTVRAEAAAAVAGVVDAEIAVPQIRDSIIANARGRCDEAALASFDKIVAQLDARGMHMLKTPKVPLHVLQAVQQHLADARIALFDRVGRAAIDRVKEIVARGDAAAAARIDEPITHRLTPRDVAIMRVADPQVAKTPAAVGETLLASIAELSGFAWRAAEQVAKAYGASQTFAVGDVIEHPKFGRGAVVAVQTQRVEVEFSDGKRSLIHAKR